MIEIHQVSKKFDSIQALSGIDLTISEEAVFGMLGTNGAGKSTLLRMIAGVLKADSGEILVDGENIFENPVSKEKLFYISDDQYYFPNSTPLDMAAFYESCYVAFDKKRFLEMLHQFQLDGRRKIATFSKGMKKQLSIILGLCSNTRYLLCDETFDGLDPVMRQGMKSIFAREIEERGLTPVIASHNLRELEDICDHIGLLHQGGILLTKELEDLKCNIHKVQCVLPEYCAEKINTMLDVLQYSRRGKLITMSVRGAEEEIMQKLSSLEPVYCEVLPLSLEEIFISETEVAGYDLKEIIL